MGRPIRSDGRSGRPIRSHGRSGRPIRSHGRSGRHLLLAAALLPVLLLAGPSTVQAQTVS
jgi:hypothetical protein